MAPCLRALPGALVGVQLLALASAQASSASAEDPFARYLALPFAPAARFDWPMGVGQFERQGFVVDDAAHAHVDAARVLWPTGPVQTSPHAIPYREVRAVAAGQVLRVQADGEVLVEHILYEDHLRRRLLSRYRHLQQTLVVAGQRVHLGSALGLSRVPQQASERPGIAFALCFADDATADGDACGDGRLADPWSFIEAHRQVAVPPHEPTLVLVDRARARLRLIVQGRAVLDTDVALGQEPGDKERRGDLRTPAGRYFVVDKSQGPFTGPYADFYGGHFIKLNYPGARDAEAGLARGLLTPAQAARIAAQWRARQPTLQDTRLGGGIGLHGWAGTWDGAQGRALSFGCIVLHQEDIAVLYRHVAPGTMVVIF